MNKYNNLLVRISNEYSIKRGNKEDTIVWKDRIIYSLLGRMAIASLSDGLEEGTVSIIHMKKRIHDVFSAYYSMYEEIARDYSELSEGLEQEIYDIFLHTGIVYHRPDRILMSKKTNAVCNGVKFTRGYELDTKQMLSGLGSYIIQDEDEKTLSLSQMFCLEETLLVDRWRVYTRDPKWTQYETDQTTQYLKKKPPFSKGYWVDKPYNDGEISILRTGFTGAYLYFLYKYDDDTLLVSQLPQWQVAGGNYRTLSNAYLANEGTLPETIYKTDGELTYVDFQYLPPPSELYLWKLYSWPKRYSNFPCDFSRVCVTKVFEAIKETMMRQGYKFRKV